MKMKERMIYGLIYFNLYLQAKATPISAQIESPFSFANCNFDSRLCPMYQHDLNAQFKWRLNEGTTSSPNTGPIADHTPGKNGKGKYIYIESSNRLNGDAARIESGLLTNKLPAGSKVCLRFHYHMKGHTMGALSVFIHKNGVANEELKFRLKGKQDSPGWNEAMVHFDVPNNPFKLIFEGKTSYSFYGDIAIDDIDLSTDPKCYFWPPQAYPRAEPPKPRTPRHGPENRKTCGKSKHNSHFNHNNNIPTKAGRVIGGNLTRKGEWPMMAMLMMKNGFNKYEHACGGTLLGIDWVVTAAHCVVDLAHKDDMKVRLGAYYRTKKTAHTQDLEIETVHVHHDYNTVAAYNNDIAVIKLKKPAKMNDYVQSVCLSSDRLEFEPKQKCYVAGWGKLWNFVERAGPFSPTLNDGLVELQSQDKCTKQYGKLITQNMQCAGTDIGVPDTCNGDSGGPLLCHSHGQWMLAGVVSWGQSEGCGIFSKYGVYTQIKAVQGWIKSVIAYPNSYPTLF